jgi:hypothetical protein
MFSPSSCGLDSRERRLVLASGLADRRANHELEDLVFGEAGDSNCRNIIVGDFVRLLGNLLD